MRQVLFPFAADAKPQAANGPDFLPSHRMAEALVQQTDDGLYCPAGDFHLDPWKPTPRAVISHAHGDHAHPGCCRYLAPRSVEGVLRLRIGAEAIIDTLA